MKTIFTILFFILSSLIVHAQNKITKSYPVKEGQEINLHFDYPKIIKISSWDKNEVSIVATVSTEDGEHIDAFILRDSVVNNTVSIRNRIDWEKIPNQYYVVANGIKTSFPTKQDFENYKKENSALQNASFYTQRNFTVNLEVKVPSSTFSTIKSTYGMIELIDFKAPSAIEATYGGIDASMNESQIGKIKLTNRYGKIYSNLQLTATEKKDSSYFTSITAEPGKGPSYDLSSSYGNIYLRRSNN
ncbi:hypothetical protein FA048_07310 [Pedobacter polaris]|uniref:Adhesin domain-containing protein n=1 Tax=Pedobacter polaris TaxID=2571273 RepID=A0A4U1CVR7_9SPHI|nr:hypothetical protein [Pedobacter polaris]TKC10008.1 hypothetical protein FA048_07310 [Pedobacter polaris]